MSKYKICPIIRANGEDHPYDLFPIEAVTLKEALSKFKKSSAYTKLERQAKRMEGVLIIQTDKNETQK